MLPEIDTMEKFDSLKVMIFSRYITLCFILITDKQKHLWLYITYHLWSKSLLNQSCFSEIFCSNTTTGTPKEEGDMIFMPNLVTTLEGIATQGPDYLYNSQVTVDIVKEIKERGLGYIMSLTILRWKIHLTERERERERETERDRERERERDRERERETERWVVWI